MTFSANEIEDLLAPILKVKPKISLPSGTDSAMQAPMQRKILNRAKPGDLPIEQASKSLW